MPKFFLKSCVVILLLLSPVVSFAGVDFDGVDDDFDCGDAVDLASTDFSIALWFYADSWHTAAGKYSTLIAKRESYAGMEWELYYQNGGDGPAEGIAFSWGNSFAYSWYTTLQPSTGEWHSLIITRSGSTWNAYLDATDGSSDANTTDANAIPSGSEAMMLGVMEKDLAGDYYFNGQMNEVAIWTNNLTTQEIILYAGSRVKRMPLQIQPSSLVFYLPMDDEEDGSSGDGDIFNNLVSTTNCTGRDGANNTGLTAKAEEVLSYP